MRRGICLLILVSSLVWCMNAAPARAQQEKLIDMVVLMDRSGSVFTNTDPEGLSIPAAALVLEHLSMLNKDNRAAVVTFGDEAHLLGHEGTSPTDIPTVALTKNIFGLVEMLEASVSETPFTFRENAPDDPDALWQLLRAQMSDLHNTDLEKGLEMTKAVLDKGDSDRKKLMVFISDGVPTVGSWNRKRLNELSNVIGERLLRKIHSGRFTKEESAEVATRFADYILEKRVSEFKEDNIEILPIAFLDESNTATGFVEYLQAIRELTSGVGEFPQARSTNLIEQLLHFLPGDSRHISLYHLVGEHRFLEESAQRSSIERTFQVPDFARQARFFFSFPGCRAAQKPRVRLYRNNSLVADSDNPVADQRVVITRQAKKDGASVYVSFKFMSSDMAPGTWKAVVTDESAGGAERLPNIDLMVDIKADVRLSVTTEPGPTQIRAEDQLTLRFSLVARVGQNSMALPIERVDSFFIGVRPDDVASFSMRMRDINYVNGKAIATWDDFSLPGVYVLKGAVYFRISDNPTADLVRTSVEEVYDVQPAQPVEAWFARRKDGRARSDSLPEVVLPALGEDTEQVFNGLIRSTVGRTVSGLSITHGHLHEQGGGVRLDKSWITFTPVKIAGLSQSSPVPFKMEAKLPNYIGDDIPDGIYTTTVQLIHGPKELDSMVVTVPLSIPRLVFEQGDVRKPYKLDEDHPVQEIRKRIYYPGQTPHVFEVPLWSTSGAETLVDAVFIHKSGLEVGEDEFDKRGRSADVEFSVDGSKFTVPGRNSSSPGIIEARVVLTDDGLNGKVFANTLDLDADQHRAQEVRLVAVIDFVPVMWLYAGAGLVALLALFFFVKAGIWCANRRWFVNYEYETEREAQQELREELRYGGALLGTFVARGDEVRFEGNGVNEFLRFQPASGRREEAWIPCAGGETIVLRLGDTLRLTRGGRAFDVVVDSVPATHQPDFSYRVEESPYGRGGRMYLYLALGVVVSLAVAYTAIDPYWVLRLLPL